MLATRTGEFVLLFGELVDGAECVGDRHFEQLNELLFLLLGDSYVRVDVPFYWMKRVATS